MLEKYEKNVIQEYVANLLANRKFVFYYMKNICEWLYSDEQIFYPFTPKDKNNKVFERNDFRDFASFHPMQAFHYIKSFSDKLYKLSHKSSYLSLSRLENNLRQMQDLLGLSEIEKNILGFFIREKCEDNFSDIYSELIGRHRNISINERAFGLNINISQLSRLTNRNSSLVKLGLLELEYDGDYDVGAIAKNLYYQKIENQTELRKFLLGKPQSATLDWQCFNHIEQAEFVYRLMQRALTTKSTGINILLYGEPGTGKTEFARTLTAKCGGLLYSLENSEEGVLGDEKNRYKQLLRVETILSKTKNNVILIDEADDILALDYYGKRDIEKIKVNRMLENNRVPVIWTTNDIHAFDKAYLRRFTYAIKFTKPTKAVVTNMWQKNLQDYNLPCDTETVSRLSKKYTISPSFICSAVKSVKLVNGGLSEVEQTLDSLQQAYNCGKEIKVQEEQVKIEFNPKLLNTDTDLTLLSERIKQLPQRNFSLCLYGASGTGKSAFGEYLGNELAMPIIKKKCSDLLSMWVGGTEQNIAAAFEEGKENQAVLIFDEADSFLQDRSNAVRSWEVTQVNEMLTQMENYPYPFICTTNLMDSLDKASLRRFTFKVAYDYMTPEQSSLAFKHFFNHSDIDLSHLNSLAPGDFVVVKQKAEILGFMNNKEELIKMLEQEQQNKALIQRKIGFL